MLGVTPRRHCRYGYSRGREVMSMTKRIVILGGGTGGTLMANRLRKR